jgi:hypothetical protein
MEERLERKKIKKACGHSDEGTLAGKVDAVQYVICLYPVEINIALSHRYMNFYGSYVTCPPFHHGHGAVSAQS